MAPTLQSLGIDRLSVDDRLQLVGAIWDSIASDSGNLPMPDWHQRELDRRLAECERNPEAGASWEEVEARLAKDE